MSPVPMKKKKVVDPFTVRKIRKKIKNELKQVYVDVPDGYVVTNVSLWGDYSLGKNNDGSTSRMIDVDVQFEKEK